LNVTVKPL